MNIIGISGSGNSGIVEALREENEARQKAELVSAYAGGLREKVSARLSGSSDTVFISEAAMLLASGIFAPGAMAANGDESGALQADDSGSADIFTYAGSKAFAHARIAARRARMEAANASIALLAPLPPGGEGSDDSDKIQKGGDASSGSDPNFTVARLQSRLRELQQELSSLEGGELPDQVKASHINSLNSRINQAMQDLNGLVQRNRG